MNGSLYRVPHTHVIVERAEKNKNDGTIPKKITANASRALGQYNRQDFYISTRALSTRLSSTGIDVFYRTIGSHLTNHGCHKKLPRASPNVNCKS
ncbi:hypothetical protein RCL_jg16420.t1 [Rhizophagus clarus]|uniref:Uncharacterized protein n=1 Tax=Rhizophagus clarus TaxID=94130 RepID=A0A8H3M5I5_9GLOM|nr:hypothetical protein RCL_jg16420.t1 [Rhizophagus clarus]